MTPSGGTLGGVSPSDDWLDDLLSERPLTVALELTVERRIRLYADRLARRLEQVGDDDPYDIDNDRDLAGLVMLLCEAALDMDERNSGLAADPLTGQLRSRDVADEEARRRLMRRDDTQQ